MPKNQIMYFAVAFLAIVIAGCAGTPTRETACATCQPCPKCPPVDASAPARILLATPWSELPGWGDDDLAGAWPAFQQTCAALAGKPQSPWKRVCDQSRAVDARSTPALRAFFEAQLTPYALSTSDGRNDGLITGYYEPLIRGSLQRGKGYSVPVLGVPGDLISVDLGDVAPETRHMRLRGRLAGNRLVPYYTRAEIEASPPQNVLLWAQDPVELFFMQVQGSGKVQLPDGRLIRLGYADQNGHPYQSIGRVLIERGELKANEASMQGIQNWARANPARLRAVLNANPSYVFFRELGASTDGPLGALGVPLTAERSLAVDQRHIPLGAPVFLATTRPGSNLPLQRLMFAQDTGGAIKGVVRADYFWGFGAAAGEQAGRMKQSGRLWILLPPELAPK